ncbi:MAG: hypothetical protein AB7P99_19960 [Vicinamibacterales bacterium]
MRIRTLLVSVVVSSLLWSSSAIAQQHIVGSAELTQALAGQAATDATNREAVTRVLQHDQMRAVAGRLGLSLTRAENAVATLGSAELASLADTARAADAQLAGGANTVVISTTTLLLVLIIVILIAR